MLDLLKLRDLNWRIAEVGAITERQMAYVQDEIADARKSIVPGIGDAVLTSPNFEQPSTPAAINALTEQLKAPDNVQTLSDTMHDRARTALGPTWQTYQRLKFEAAVRRLADELAKKLSFPDKSAPASFLRAVFLAWVRRHPAWRDGGEELSELLRATDVPYRERRLMFILAGINELYRRDGAKGAPPPRNDLDEMKKTAWTMLERLRDYTRSVVRGFSENTVKFLQRVDDETMLTNPDEFVHQHIEEFDTVFNAYRVTLTGPLDNDSFELWKVFKESTSAWADDDKQALLSRYLGFPLWDGLIFPTVSLTELPQLTPIGVAQFSPLAATALYAVENGKPTTKLKGLPLHHFAAFMNAASRENDYLWGRLDGAELILRNLQAVDNTRRAATPGPTATLPPLAEAFTCVLNTEAALKRIPNELRDSLEKQIKNLSQSSTPGGA